MAEFNELLNRGRIYCDYRERCHSEVRSKLFDLGANGQQVNEIIAVLIEENLLNEERFSRAFCRGKFIYNHWGKNKIIQHLKQKQISEYCIQAGLKEIDEDDYYGKLKKLLLEYTGKIKGLKSYQMNKKAAVYLMQKGYESSLIWKTINEIQHDN